MFNKAISSWLIDLKQLREVKKSLIGKNAVKVLILRDITIVFREY
jgi:hypothetical protein